MATLLSVLFSLFLSLNAFSEEQACPFGSKFNGEFCIDYSGNKQCPNGQYFDYPYNMCVPEYFKDMSAIEENSSAEVSCNSSIIDDITGETRCKMENASVRSEVKRSNTASQKSRCEQAISSTKTVCAGVEIATQMSAMLRTVESQRQAGNIKQACDKAGEVAQIMTAGNSAYAVSCSSSVNSCKTACANDAEISVCENYENKIKLATAQSALSAVNFAQSKACSDAASGQCVGEEAYLNSECAQFCTHPLRQNHPKCVVAQSNCQNAQYAAQNIQLCVCINNPKSSACASQAIAVENKDSSSTSAALNLDSSLAGQDYDGNDIKESKSAESNSPSSGNSVLQSGSGSSFAMNGAQSPSQKEKLDKDILKGSQNGNASGAFIGGHSSGQGVTGAFRSGSGQTNSEINLQDYLPNGKKAPQRNPAQAKYSDPTITAANGLTNFQKITRKMNEKRPELMP